ncbi:MAG: hypothetical protein HY396_00920 [Candidatus Doudnabacteria bacterium]|nr:hypothetical protein [Candidatus Doudnabacteria bacterium]
MTKEGHDDLAGLAKSTGVSLTYLLRLSLGMLSLVHEETLEGNRLIVVDREGNPLREVVLPR